VCFSIVIAGLMSDKCSSGLIVPRDFMTLSSSLDINMHKRNLKGNIANHRIVAGFITATGRERNTLMN
jgi:hypothetical protein